MPEAFPFFANSVIFLLFTKDQELLKCLEEMCIANNITENNGVHCHKSRESERKFYQSVHVYPAVHMAPLLSSGTSNNSEIVQALESINKRLEVFQSQPTGLPQNSVGSALNAARQVAYWPSVFVSMCHNHSSELPLNTQVSQPVSHNASQLPQATPPQQPVSHNASQLPQFIRPQ